MQFLASQLRNSSYEIYFFELSGNRVLLTTVDLLSKKPWAAAKKQSVSVAVSPAPVRVPSQRPHAPSVASVTSVANDKEMILGAVDESPGICLTAEENPRKPQLEGRLMKELCDQSSLQMGSLSSK